MENIKTYTVEVHRYPETATSPEQARRKAANVAEFSVWETQVVE